MSDVSLSTLTLLWLHVPMIQIPIHLLSLYLVSDYELDLLERWYGWIIKYGILDVYEVIPIIETHKNEQILCRLSSDYKVVNLERFYTQGSYVLHYAFLNS